MATTASPASTPVGRRIWLWPLLALLAIYRLVLSPLIHLFAPGTACRYEPSCSAYAVDALRQYGALKGLWLTARRFLDCHPWGHFGVDPVPPHWPGWFARRRDYYAHGAEAKPHGSVSRCCHRTSQPS